MAARASDARVECRIFYWQEVGMGATPDDKIRQLIDQALHLRRGEREEFIASVYREHGDTIGSRVRGQLDATAATIDTLAEEWSLETHSANAGSHEDANKSDTPRLLSGKYRLVEVIGAVGRNGPYSPSTPTRGSG